MDSLTHRGLTANMVNAALVAGSGVSLTTTAITTPVLDGKFGTTYAVLATQAPPTVDLNTGAAPVTLVGGNSVANTPGEGAVGVYGLVAGVVRYVQGPKSKLDMLNSFVGDPQFPSIPENFVPFAYIVAKARATDGVSVIVGTTAWASYTAAIINVFQLPSRPQVA